MCRIVIVIISCWLLMLRICVVAVALHRVIILVQLLCSVVPRLLLL